MMKNDEANAAESESRKDSDLREVGDGVESVTDTHEFELML
jgi:hypothetical protein